MFEKRPFHWTDTDLAIDVEALVSDEIPNEYTPFERKENLLAVYDAIKSKDVDWIISGLTEIRDKKDPSEEGGWVFMQANELIEELKKRR